MLSRYAKRIFTTAFVFFISGMSQSIAGILVTDSDKIVTSYTANDGTVYYFHQGSYNDLAAQLVGLDSADAQTHAQELANHLNNKRINNYDPNYVFPIFANGSSVDTYVVYSIILPPAQWLKTSRNLDRSATNGIDGLIYYATTTAPSGAVPEPSTAIAMGLLGIVGFAGNRRRRRQS